LLAPALGRALSKQEKAFVDLLLKNGRINTWPSILALFSAMSDLNSDAKAFHVTSAYKLSKKEEDEIIKDLSDKYKSHFLTTSQQTPFLVYLTLCLALR
jgi:F-type H+-transporting ATPase subunit delta